MKSMYGWLSVVAEGMRPIMHVAGILVGKTQHVAVSFADQVEVTRSACIPMTNEVNGYRCA